MTIDKKSSILNQMWISGSNIKYLGNLDKKKLLDKNLSCGGYLTLEWARARILMEGYLNCLCQRENEFNFCLCQKQSRYPIQVFLGEGRECLTSG